MNEFKKISADIESEKIKTQLKKEQFIRQIKSGLGDHIKVCLLYTSPSPRDRQKSRMPSSA